ncbi:MAG TPA: hypothetical protein VF306_15575 [Pirellulales bacterium]
MINHRSSPAIRRAATALVCASLPSVISWLLLAALMVSREKAPPVGSPNPAKAPIWMQGPGDLLVYGDPWVAGTGYFWYVLEIAIVIGLVAWSVVTTADAANRKAAGQHRVWFQLVAISIAVGFVLAGPWYYALLRALGGKT